MRLAVLDSGHRLRVRLFFVVKGRDAPDIVRMLLYRPEFFARPLWAITALAMWGPFYWTLGEREYLAMRIAELYRCPFACGECGQARHAWHDVQYRVWQRNAADELVAGKGVVEFLDRGCSRRMG